MNILDFIYKKKSGNKISMITCYDYPSAKIVAESDIDCVLVGDSVAMTVHGFKSTIMATIEMMALHTEAVARGISQQFIISDLPFLCHRKETSEVISDIRTLCRAGAQAIKIEGGDPEVCALVKKIVTSGVPVMGHIGLLPQSIHQLGGYKVQGKESCQKNRLLAEAKALEEAGCFALVIESVPEKLAYHITQSLTIPTIGIGAGSYTDGQVLVWHDVLGLQTEIKPRFIKQFINGKEAFIQAINHYVRDVQAVQFPSSEHSFQD